MKKVTVILAIVILTVLNIVQYNKEKFNGYYINCNNNEFIMYDSLNGKEIFKGCYNSEVGRAMLKDNL